MPFIIECFQSFVHTICSKGFRVFVMFVLTIITATVEIVYGIRSHSQLLLADGLYSFAEGLCLIGVMVVLHYSHTERNRQKNNTFGYQRLELLFGLIQEVFLLSISLGIIVDAVNHLVNPAHVDDPMLMIVLGGSGIFVGILGMAMFWGYHHDHNIEEEIQTKKKKDFVAWTKKNAKLKRNASAASRKGVVVEVPLVPPETTQKETINHVETEPAIVHQHSSELDAFTYENVEIGESKIYATLHALCLHSFVVLLESVIVVVSGLVIKFIPHTDPLTGKEIHIWLKYIDPALTLIMVVVIAVRALPVIFSISEILIENVPGGIDTQKLMKEIVTAIPAIKSIHSLHVWRATAKEIYATLHLTCDEDIMLSTCTYKYGRDIQKILKSYCIRYFTLQFEHVSSNSSDQVSIQRCIYGLHRKRRGHTLNEPMKEIAKDSRLTFIRDEEDSDNIFIS